MKSCLISVDFALMGDDQRIITSKTNIDNARGSRFAACMVSRV